MARIRSIHPGLLTDEAWMTLTVEAPLACALYVGLLCEADDRGVFEWKPITLKARILPATSVDIAGLLDTLAETRFVMRYEAAGRTYGAIRNFGRYQRPKRPKYVHPVTLEVEAWCAVGGEPTVEDAVEEAVDEEDDASRPTSLQSSTGAEPPPHSHGRCSEQVRELPPYDTPRIQNGFSTRPALSGHKFGTCSERVPNSAPVKPRQVPNMFGTHPPLKQPEFGTCSGIGAQMEDGGGKRDIGNLRDTSLRSVSLVAGVPPTTPDRPPAGPREVAHEPQPSALAPRDELSLPGIGPPRTPPARPDPVLEAYRLYNTTAELAGLPKALRLTEERRAKLRQRLADAGGLDGWRAALDKLARSPHCTGQNDRGWRADLDFLLQKSSFLRLLEGRYDPRRPCGAPDAGGVAGPPPPSIVEAALEAALAAGETGTAIALRRAWLADRGDGERQARAYLDRRRSAAAA